MKRLFKWVRYEGEIYWGVGFFEDGTLRNPNGYPEEIVRAAVIAAIERRQQKRSNAAKAAAKTRNKRQEKKIYETARRLVADGELTPGLHCDICGKHLDDPVSIARAIGSECWQHILQAMERIKIGEAS